MRVQVVDPSAYTPAYDHALCAALADAGAEVELVTSRFAYGDAPAPTGYALRELFYRRARGPAGSRLRLATKLLEHMPDMLALRRHALAADVVHFQWLAVQPVDRRLLPSRPTVLTAHDLLPREPRPLQVRAHQRLYEAVDAVVAHSEFGRRRLVDQLRIDPAKVRVIHHGAFDYLTRVPVGALPGELGDATAPGEDAIAPGDATRRVVMFFGLLRPYKGIEVLLDAWRQLDGRHEGAELWIVGRPRMPTDDLRSSAPGSVKWVTRFVTDPELAACFRRADALVLPYLRTDRLDFSGVLATALAFAKPAIVSDVGGFAEVADAGGALLVPPGDAPALAAALGGLLADGEQRARLAAGARAAADASYSWQTAARQTLALYRELADRN
jgi:glycosyltransferase involved in cell wall biosynthesis